MPEHHEEGYPFGPGPRDLHSVPEEMKAKSLWSASDDSLDSHVDPEAEEQPDFDIQAVSRWRPARSLEVLRDQVNRRWPNRRRDSDGLLGDFRHCGGGAPSSSDHCPWVRDGNMGVVTAIDITHDPANGCSAGALAEALIEARDPRIKYIIWNRRIISSSKQPWQWRRYTGRNPHTTHVHISVKSTKEGAGGYDSTAAWPLPSGFVAEASGRVIQSVGTRELQLAVGVGLAAAGLALVLSSLGGSERARHS